MRRLPYFFAFFSVHTLIFPMNSIPSSQSIDTMACYLPMNVGNVWNYRYALPDSGLAMRNEIFDTTRIDGKLYYAFGTNSEYPYLIRADSLNRIWRRTQQGEVLWFDTTLDDSATYQVAFFTGDPLYTVTVRRNITIETFAGQFTGCIEFFFDIPEHYDEEQWFTLAPNIGIVSEQYASVKQLLFSAVINGRIITKVEEQSESPLELTLRQNYPNPFNPTTRIEYRFPDLSQIKLVIYNTLGRKIRVLVNERQMPGSYYVQWDGKDDDGFVVASGVYIYRLISGSLVKSRKMLLAR